MTRKRHTQSTKVGCKPEPTGDGVAVRQEVVDEVGQVCALVVVQQGYSVTPGEVLRGDQGGVVLPPPLAWVTANTSGSHF